MKGTLGCETLGEQLQGCGTEGHDATWAQGVMVSLQGWAGCFPYLPGLQGSGHLGGHQSRMSVPVPTSRSQPQRSRRQAFRWLTRAHSPLPRSDRLPAWPSLSSAPPGAGRGVGGWVLCAGWGRGPGEPPPRLGWRSPTPIRRAAFAHSWPPCVHLHRGWEGQRCPQPPEPRILGLPSPSSQEPKDNLFPLPAPSCTGGQGWRDGRGPAARGRVKQGRGGLHLRPLSPPTSLPAPT